jgi:hypothetical protein
MSRPSGFLLSALLTVLGVTTTLPMKSAQAASTYLDSAQSADVRAEDLVARLTLEKKAWPMFALARSTPPAASP